MKKVLIMAVAGFLLGAMSVAAQAAGPLQTFVSDDNKVFQVEHALSVTKVPGALEVVTVNGTTYSYADATGALYTKVLNSAGFAAKFVQVGSTLIHMNTNQVTQITCYGGNQTAFAYPFSSVQVRFFPDACVLFNKVKTNSQ